MFTRIKHSDHIVLVVLAQTTYRPISGRSEIAFFTIETPVKRAEQFQFKLSFVQYRILEHKLRLALETNGMSTNGCFARQNYAVIFCQ